MKVFEALSKRLIYEESNKDGAASMFNRWQERSSISKQDYYLSYLNDRIKQVAKRTEINPAEATVIISGMAGSSIGMLELPYAMVPFGLNGRGAVVRRLENNKSESGIYLISGISNGRDIMRGEETQLAGLSAMAPALFLEDSVCILPGTHSKHVYIHQGAIVSFKTYMTGEMFSVLNEHSILKPAIPSEINPSALTSADMASFSAGVRRSQSDSLLHSLFTVRTNKVLKGDSDRKNFLFLSGLLIGNELTALAGIDTAIILCSTGNVHGLYQQALTVLGLAQQTTFISPEQMENSYWEGQLKIFDHFIQPDPSDDRKILLGQV
jgi:2-dehydro-3-deoxygalactonokinase